MIFVYKAIRIGETALKCTTPCPYKVGATSADPTPNMIGSYACIKCRFNKSNNMRSLIVKCAYECNKNVFRKGKNYEQTKRQEQGDVPVVRQSQDALREQGESGTIY